MSEHLPDNAVSTTPDPSTPDLATCLDGYARILVEHALDLRPGQTLYIWGELVHSELALKVGEAAYEAGAGLVCYLLENPLVTEQLIRRGGPHQIDRHVLEKEARLVDISRSGAALLAIEGKSDPDRLSRLRQAHPENHHHLISEWQIAFSRFVRRVTDKRLSPTVLAPGPTPGWAKRVWPEDDEDEAHRKLAEHLWRFAGAAVADRDRLHACRLALDALGIRQIRIRGGGNQLELGLSDEARWLDAAFETHTGQRFLYNVPSFEVCTTPDRRTAEGRLIASRPIRLPGGELVEGLELELHRGRVVRYAARQGEEALRAWLDVDDGARFLGEIALVGDSPIVACGRSFEHFLVDENAASHIALGQGIREAFVDDRRASAEKLEAAGFNRSKVHLDIPFGSPDVELDALTSEGETLPLLQEGRWTEIWQQVPTSRLSRSRELVAA